VPPKFIVEEETAHGNYKLWDENWTGSRMTDMIMRSRKMAEHDPNVAQLVKLTSYRKHRPATDNCANKMVVLRAKK